MLDQKIRERWDRVMRPVGRALGGIGLSANAMTVAGLGIQAGVAVLILQGRLLLAGLIGIVAALSDGFDGAIAKAKGTTSRFGALLDSTTDRLGEAFIYAAIAWLYGVSPDIAERDVPWVAAVAVGALIGSFLVSYVRARAEALDLECKVGIAERAERMILIIAGLILDLVPWMLSILTLAAWVTVMQRLVHVARQER